MLMEFAGTARDIGRLAEIGGVLVRHGFGDAARRLGMAHAVERAGEALNWKGAAGLAQLETRERVCHALQDLGPTFVKLGQLLATRVDLFPPEWIAEFEKLQDRAPPADHEQVRAQLIEDLGAAPEEVFAEFGQEPIAAGSIAQVHRARLADGTAVAVKVRRPGIQATVEADLSLLARLARIAEARLPDLARLNPREVVRRFTQTMRAELDLAVECRSAERVALGFRDDPGIVVPRVYWQWTGERINVQEYIEGLSSRDPAAIDRAGLDRKALAHRGAQAMLKMVIEDGFFHADPHPGNLFYLPDNRIAFIDFGMTGRLTGARRDELVMLLSNLVDRDAEAAAEILLDWAGPVQVDADALTSDIDAFVDRYHGVPLRELRAASMLTDLARLLREHKLALPPDLALVLKVCIELETTGRELDSGFDMVAEAEPFLRAAALARRGPAALARRGWRAGAAALELLSELPLDLRRLLRSARNGRLQVHVDLTALASFGAQLDRAASRLTVGVVTAALIIGSSIVMTVPGGPVIFGLPLFGLAGFLGAVAGGAWLLLSVWRSGRRR
jgi:ubiquinone biosynthesis protein